MHLTSTIALAALPLLVLGSPVQDTAHGVRVPIEKRASLTNSDGTVNIDALRGQVEAATRKMERGFDMYEKNTGKRHPLAPDRHHKRKTGADALTAQGTQLWYGTISVGTPAKTFTVDFDTGSSDIFLPGPNCTTTCAGHTIYNPKNSSTATAAGATFSLAYGDGSIVNGQQYSDTVTISGLTSTKQPIGVANQYSPSFAKSSFTPDGLVGMAYKSLSAYGQNPLFQNLVAQSQTTSSVFAFKLATSGSELYLGGVDTSLYKGSITYTPVTQQAYWQVALQNVKVNSTQVLSSLTAIIDTGTTLIVGDTASVKALYSKIPGAADASSTIGSGYYTLPCNAIPTVYLTFNGVSFPIPTSTFNLGRVSSTLCVGGIVGSSNNFWIIGDAFLRGVYSVFDQGNNRVGFATLA